MIVLHSVYLKKCFYMCTVHSFVKHTSYTTIYNICRFKYRFLEFKNYFICILSNIINIYSLCHSQENTWLSLSPMLYVLLYILYILPNFMHPSWTCSSCVVFTSKFCIYCFTYSRVSVSINRLLKIIQVNRLVFGG